jgi:hypothetical protein
MAYLYTPATAFERQVRKLGLDERTCVASKVLRLWCEENKDRYYIPEWLLARWGMTESKLREGAQRLSGLATPGVFVSYATSCPTQLPSGYPSPIGRISSKSMVGRQGRRQCETRGHSGRDFGACGGHDPTDRVQRQHRLLKSCQLDSMIH